MSATPIDSNIQQDITLPSFKSQIFFKFIVKYLFLGVDGVLQTKQATGTFSHLATSSTVYI